MKKIVSIILVFTLCFCSSGCSDKSLSDIGANTTVVTPTQTTIPTSVDVSPSTSPTDITETVSPSDSGEEIPATFVDFHGRNNVGTYFKTLMAISEPGNGLYSPVSLSCALDMYRTLIEHNKAYDEVTSFLNGIDYRAYHGLGETENGAYRIVNRIWYNNQKSFDFEKTPDAKPYLYGVDASNSVSATNEKNQFVNDMTNGFINSTPTEFTMDLVIDVMNIVYFKDAWRGGDLDLTSIDIDFHNYDGTISSQPMMIVSNGHYYENETCYAVPISYENGMLFYAVYPKNSLNDVSLDDIFENDVYKDVDIYFPEFEAKSTHYLSAYKDMLGLSHFNEGRLICYSASEPVPEIIQVAKIRCDHTGTEATAVTEVMMNDAIAFEEEKLELTFDKPFAYFITDPNGDVAFIGKVETMN